MTHVFQEGLLVGGGTRGQSDAGADIVERLQRFGAVLVPVLHGKCLSLVQEDLGIAQYDPVLSRAARDPRLVSVYEVFAQVITRYGRSGGSGVFIGLVSVLAANEASIFRPIQSAPL